MWAADETGTLALRPTRGANIAGRFNGFTRARRAACAEMEERLVVLLPRPGACPVGIEVPSDFGFLSVLRSVRAIMCACHHMSVSVSGNTAQAPRARTAAWLCFLR